MWVAKGEGRCSRRDAPGPRAMLRGAGAARLPLPPGAGGDAGGDAGAGAGGHLLPSSGPCPSRRLGDAAARPAGLDQPERFFLPPVYPPLRVPPPWGAACRGPPRPGCRGLSAAFVRDLLNFSSPRSGAAQEEVRGGGGGGSAEQR